MFLEAETRTIWYGFMAFRWVVAGCSWLMLGAQPNLKPGRSGADLLALGVGL